MCVGSGSAPLLMMTLLIVIQCAALKGRARQEARHRN
ncbi:BQ5605_C002g01527 [Microbotryum silenes-dioicae]|uniref:BQ5605_C002g01527 protein n=1 Tax=Microbotryum silenes-dioicae TaxID=796604 RepID=A0A2X0MTS6_9BASI|nr:BQ5605_C002g01527 [Microbotryum silenes-dioicae]